MAAEDRLILCPFAAEAKLLAGLLPDCRQLDHRTWQSRSWRIQTLDGAGAGPLHEFFSNSDSLNHTAHDRIFLFGAAGALQPDLEPGQVVVCEQLQFEQQQIDLADKTASARAPGRKTQISTVKQITVATPITSAAERLLKYRQTGAAIVDMESYFLAKEALAKGLQPLIIRFISDTATQPFKLPFAANVRLGVIKARAEILKLLQL